MVSGMMDDLRDGQSEQSTNLARQRASEHIPTEIDVDEDNGSPELENRDKRVTSACRTMVAKLKAMHETDARKGHFAWWKQSCHYHTMLECVIFAIIENGGERLFKQTQFGWALTQVFLRSRTCDRDEVSKAFRVFFHGTEHNDASSVTCGTGHGGGEVGDTASLQDSVLQILGELGFRFVTLSCLYATRSKEKCSN